MFQQSVESSIGQYGDWITFGHVSKSSIARSISLKFARVDVFAPGEFAVVSDADFEHGRDAAVVGDGSGRGGGDAGEEFEEGRLAGAVVSDDAKAFSLADFEVDVVEGEVSLTIVGVGGVRWMILSARRCISSRRVVPPMAPRRYSL